jgi:putative intracellular protease/amidase
MRWQIVVWSGVAVLTLLLAAGAAWILTLPPVSAAASGPKVSQDEANATVAALRPPKRSRPLIAIIGINDATETTDYLMPYGILKRADVADVLALATEPGPVKLYPALTVEADATVSDFDERYPDGADYVIVPAMSRDDDPAALAFIRRQASQGAIIIGVCAGAKVVGDAGLLDGKRATTHWYFVRELLDKHPTIRRVRDRRLVVDQGVATTTGISAAMPTSLILIEAIAGRAKAEAVARDLGLTEWDASHDSNTFELTRPFALTVLGNTLALWNRERLGIKLSPGIDDVSLALVADAWSRTYRSHAVTFAGSAVPLQAKSGIRILPDVAATNWSAQYLLRAIENRRPAEALNQALSDIAGRYGERTAEVVAMQLEYARQGASR